MGKIGIDTSVFIYVFEENKTYGKAAENVLYRVRSGETLGVFSGVGLIEILTGPKKEGRFTEASAYRELILSFPHLTLYGLTARIVDIASDLRAKYGIATPDAIHIATALDFGANEFITGDKKLKRVKEIKIKLLQ